MCTSPAEALTSEKEQSSKPESASDVAAFLAEEPEIRRTAAGFIGYGDVKSGDQVLVGVDNQYDYQLVASLCEALRSKGANVDIVTVDIGQDREFAELDEIDVIIRREDRRINPRRWDSVPWIEDLASSRKYDLLIHKKGGGIPKTEHRYEAIPWLTMEQFTSEASVFPRNLHTLINRKAWEPFHSQGIGGTVRLTDPEGTDLTYTLFPDYFDGTRRSYGEEPFWGHLLAHGPTPIIPQEDATGVVAGTTNHFSRPFPRIELDINDGRVTSIRGGNRYGEAWRELMDETQSIQYPCFPGPGLFYLWEVAIGTHPRIARPSDISRHSSGGFEWERRRSGIIHMGFGTRWGGPEETWAAGRSIPYGHLHVHLLFPTLTITPPGGGTIAIIEDGHLLALDDPEVRNYATEFGTPDDLLSELWIPQIPGISGPGSYADYAADPAGFIYA